jgi:hypothetical protein
MPNWPSHQVVRANDDHAKSLNKYYHDRHYGVRPLAPLSPGQPVLLRTDNPRAKSWTPSAHVLGTASTPRSIIVQTESGKSLRRNRRHVQAVPRVPNVPQQNTPVHDPGPPSTPVKGDVSVNVNTGVNVNAGDRSSPVKTRSGRTVIPRKLLDL